MGSPRQTVCGAGLHDLRDPANVGTYRRHCGRVSRFCKPCNKRRTKDRWKRRREAASTPMRRQRPVRASAPGMLQAHADGESVQEIAERLGITPDAVYGCLARQRARYGVQSNAAAVAYALAAEDIRPVKGQPLPPRTSTTRGHTRSLLRLIRGERRTRAPGARRERMLDDLYAFSEAHAVSALWAAGIITAGDIHPQRKAAA